MSLEQLINSSSISRFTSWAAARSFAQGALKPQMIIMGDDMRFWVVSLADGARLIKAGYEAIN